MLLRTVLNMCITASYICIAVIILRFFMKKLPAKYSYMLWAIPLIRLICPFSVSSAISIFNIIKPASASGHTIDFIAPDTAFSASPVIDTGIPTSPASAETVTFPLPAPQESNLNSVNPIQIWAAVLTVIWIIGIAAAAIYSLICIMRLKRVLKNSRPLKDNVMLCGGIETPFVFGLVKPKIYIPEGTAESSLEYIIAHENVHIHRKDYIIKPLAFAVLAVYWFNPLFWVCCRLMESDMERSCDEAALSGADISTRKAYANALLDISVKKNRLHGARLVSFGENSVKTRIRSVLKYKKPAAAAGIFAGAAAIIAAVCLLTDGNGSLKIKNVTSAEIVEINTLIQTPAGGDTCTPIDSGRLSRLINGMKLTEVSAERWQIPDKYEDQNYLMLDLWGKNTEYSLLLLPPFLTDDIGLTGTAAYEKLMAVNNNGSEKYYLMSDSDYDRLMSFISESITVFPKGKYIYTGEAADRLRTLMVSETADGKTIALCYGEETSDNGTRSVKVSTLKTFLKAEASAYGMRLVYGNDEAGTAFEYIGNGNIRVYDGPLKSLSLSGTYSLEKNFTLTLASNNEIGSGYDKLLCINDRYELHSDLSDIYFVFSPSEAGYMVCGNGAAITFENDFLQLENAHVYLADLNSDETPDIAIVITDPDNSSFGIRLIDGKTLEEILPDASDDEKLERLGRAAELPEFLMQLS